MYGPLPLIQEFAREVTYTLLPEESVKEKDVMVLKSEHVHIMSFAN